VDIQRKRVAAVQSEDGQGKEIILDR